MAGGANSAFLADPIGFLKNNIIRVQYEGPDTTVPVDFDLVDSGVMETKKDKAAGISKNSRLDREWTGLSATGETMKVYDLVGFSGGFRPKSHPIKAYWLGFEANAARSIQLGVAARFMFTVTLNGCSIGVGPGKHPKVAHVNKQVEVNGLLKTDQTLMDMQIKGEIPDGRTLLAKPDYCDGNGPVNATFLGILRGEEWRFFWQSRKGILEKASDKVTVTEQQPLTWQK
jgi:hypothetical protein